MYMVINVVMVIVIVVVGRDDLEFFFVVFCFDCFFESFLFFICGGVMVDGNLLILLY